MTSKMNFYAYLSYFILAIFISLILFFPSTVNAATLTPRSAIENFLTNNRFDYTGTSDYEERPQENWTFYGSLGTTYNRALYGIRAYFNYSIVKNHSYRITVNNSSNNFYSTYLGYYSPQFCFGSSYVGATSNCVSGSLYNVSSSSVSYIFRSNVNSSYFRFSYGPITNKDYYLTSSYSFNLSSFSIDDLNAVPTSPSNSDVINNDNQNTTTILDSINEQSVFIDGRINTTRDEIIDFTRQAEQNIINNQNSNNNALLENASCPVGPLPLPFEDWVENSSQYLKSDGSIGTTSIGISLAQLGISPYFSIKPSTEYNLSLNNGSNSNYYYCFYRSNKSLISCSPLSSSSITFTSPSNSMYFRFTMFAWSGATLSGPVCNDWQKEKLNDIDNSINGIKDYISDDSDPNSNSIVDSLDDIGVGNGPISSLVTLPITLLDKFEDGISSTCTPFSLGNLLGTNLSLPCIDIPDLIGSNLWTIIDAITSIFMIYNIVMLIIIAFDHLTSLSDDFDTLYTPDSIYESRLVKKRGYERHGD